MKVSAQLSFCCQHNTYMPPHASYIIYIHETDYLINPKEVLARIFSFATRGLIDKKIDLNKFVPSQAGITLKQKKQLKVSLHRSLS